jgi:hypothetical protein
MPTVVPVIVQTGCGVLLLTVVKVTPVGRPVAVTVMLLKVSTSVGTMDMEKGPTLEQILKSVLSNIVPAVAVL